MKEKIYRLVEKGSHGSRVNLIFDYFILILIVLNVLAIALETITQINGSFIGFFRIFEVFSVVIFTIEFLLRIYISDLTHPASNKFRSAIKFIFSPFGLVDLLAILPFYVPFIIKADLRFLRVIRLTRFFRIFKISRYNYALKLLWDVIKDKKVEFKMTFIIASLMLVVSAFLIYYAENPVQPEKFSNILTSLWWAVSTLTTVGYGDIVPVTASGKIISSFVAVLGIGIIALPTGIISAGLIEKMNQKKTAPIKNICPHCGKEILKVPSEI